MADLTVKISADTSNFEQGMARVRALTAASVGDIGTQATQAGKAISTMGDAYQKNLAAFQAAQKAQDDLKRSQDALAQTYNEGARAYDKWATVFLKTKQDYGAITDAYQKNATAAISARKAQEDFTNSYSAGARAYQANIQQYVQGAGALSLAAANNVTAMRGLFSSFLQGTQQMGQQAGALIEMIGPSLTKIGVAAGAAGAAMLAMAGLGIKAAADFQSAFTDVEIALKLNDTATASAAEQYQELAENLHNLSVQTGVSAEDLAKLSGEAATLGAKGVEGVTSFVQAVTMIGKVTGISASEVALGMARITSAFGLGLDATMQLGNALESLRKTTAASPQAILQLTELIGPMADALGISAQAAMGMAAAMAGTGGQAFFAANAFNTMGAAMQRAAMVGGGMGKLFADVMHLADASIRSTEDFARALEQDGTKAITTFIEGLGKLSKNSQEFNAVLDELGLGSARYRRIILSLVQTLGEGANAQSLLRTKVEQSTDAFNNGNAVAEDFRKKMEGLNDAMTQLWRAVEAGLVTAFKPFLSIAESAVRSLTGVLEVLRQQAPLLLQIGAGITIVGGSFLTAVGSAALFVRGSLEVIKTFGMLAKAYEEYTTAVAAGKAVGILETLAFGWANASGTAITWIKKLVAEITGGGGLSAAFQMIKVAIGPTGWLLLGLAALAGAAYYAETRFGLLSAAIEKINAIKPPDWLQNMITAARGGQSEEDVQNRMQAAMDKMLAEQKARTIQVEDVVDPEWLAQMNMVRESITGATPAGGSLSDQIRGVADQADRLSKTLKDIDEVSSAINNKGKAGAGGPSIGAGFPETFALKEARVKAESAAIERARAEQNAFLGLSVTRGTTGTVEQIDLTIKAYEQAQQDAFVDYQKTLDAMNKHDKNIQQQELAAKQAWLNKVSQLTVQIVGETGKRIELTRQQIEEEYQFEQGLIDKVAALYENDVEAFKRSNDEKLRADEQAAIKRSAAHGELKGLGDFGVDQLNDALNKGQEYFEKYVAAIADQAPEAANRLLRIAAAYRTIYNEQFLLTKQVESSRDTLNGAAAAVGSYGEEFYRQSESFNKFHIAYAQLNEDQRQQIDSLARARAEIERNNASEKILKDLHDSTIPALNAEADAFGKIGIAADVARQAQLVYHTSVENLTDAQRKLLTTQQELIVATQALKQASDLYYALGIPKYEGAIIALQAMEIQADQAKLQSALSTLQTINDSRQKSDQLHAQLLAAEGQREGNFWKFVTGQVQGAAATMDTVWQGLGKMMVDTFSNVQRSLSDVFFNVFTNQTQSLKDVFKNLMNSILRSIADFLASATVKAFLSFLGNLMQGQGAGEAAGNALGSLFASPTAGQSGGTLTGSTSLLNTLSGGTGAIGSVLRGLGFNAPNAPVSTGTSGGGYALTAPGSMTLNSQGVYPTSFSTPVVTSGNSSLFGGDVSGLSGLADFVGTSGSFFDYSSTFGAFTGQDYATGGWVPGAGRGDIVPAMLEPGEFVVRRSVAESMGPALDLLNGGGRGRPQNGRLHFATGGTVDLSGLSGLTTSDLQTLAVLQAIYMVQQQQLATQQQIGSNTGQTAVALTGSQAPAPTAGATQIIGTGSGVQPVTVGGSGMAASAGSGGGTGTGGGGSAGPSSLQQILPLLQSAAGLGGSAAKLGNLFFNPGGQAGTDFTKNLNAVLGLLGGGLNLTSGIASGNLTQSIGGGISFLGGVTGLTGVQSYLNELAPNLIGNLGLGSVASGALSIAGGGLGLYTGITDMIKNGVSAQNVISTILSGAGVYSGVAGLTGLPTISAGLSALGSSLSGTALGTALGIGAGTAAPVAGGAAGLGAGVAAGGATTAAAGSGAAFGTLGVGVTAGIVMAPLLIGMIVDMVTSIQEKNRADARIFRAKQDLRTVIPQIIDQVPKVANEAWGIVNDPNASIGDLKAIYDKVHSTIDLYNTYDNYFKTGTGAYGMVKVPQLVEIDKQLQPYLQGLHLEIIRGADRLTTMGAPPSAADPLLQPLTLGLQVGLPLTSADPLVQGLQHYMQGVTPEGYGLTNVGGLLIPSDLLNQVSATVQPGHLEQGLLALANLYGGQIPDTWKAVGFGTAGGPAITGLQKMDTTGLSRLAAAITPTDPMLKQGLIDVSGGSSSPTQVLDPNTFYESVLRGGTSADASAQFAALVQAQRYEAFTSGGGGMQEGGWVPGLSTGRDSVPMMLEPGEFVIPRPQAKKYGPMLSSMLGHGQAATMAPVATAVHNAIHITVNGNVDDPQELARVLAPKLRDELRRIEPRYSRAGNKTQV